MRPNELWQQILASPTDEDLKEQYIIALRVARSPRATLFRAAEDLYQLVHGYFEREAALKREYQPLEDTWRAEFAASTAKWGAEIRFIRGWPIELTIGAAQFTEHAAEIVTVLPIRHLNLTGVTGAPQVFNMPQLTQIASINGSEQRWSELAIRAVATSPYVENLRWLSLSDTGIRDEQIEVLAASLRLRHLEHLDLSKNPGRDPVDAAAGYGTDGCYGYIVPESIWLPGFGRELEAKYGPIHWLHALSHYMEAHPPSRYKF